MKKLLILSLLFARTLSAQSVNVPVKNPSFEALMNLINTDLCGKWMWQPIPDWAPSGSSGSGVIDWVCQPPPDGIAVAYLFKETISQDLGVPPKMGVYLLKFWVANWFYAYIGDYTASITEGARTVCSTSGWAMGDFTQITMVCPVSNYISNDYKFWSSPGTLVLSFSNSQGWPIILDDVSLTFTPTN